MLDAPDSQISNGIRKNLSEWGWGGFQEIEKQLVDKGPPLPDLNQFLEVPQGVGSWV